MRLLKLRPTSYLLVAVLVVAAILRLNHITQPFNDAFSWRQSDTAIMADNFYHRNWNIFYPGVSWNGPEPNYQGMEFQTVTYIAALLYRLVGQHDWVGRGVAVVFGLWGIFALYQLVRCVWDEERAIASAALMAILPGSIFIDRSFLPDPVMVALVTTSCWLLVAYLQSDRWHYLLLASAVGAWGFMTKLPGLIVGIPMLYGMLTILYHQQKLNFKKLATITMMAVITLAAVIAYYLWARHLSLNFPPYHIAASGNWLWDDGLAQWLSHKYFFPELKHHFTGWIWTVPVIVLVLFSLLFPPPKQKHQSLPDEAPFSSSVKAPLFFHWWLLAGLIFYVFGAKELVHNPWNFHIINPAAAALGGHALVSITSFATRPIKSHIAIVITAILLLFIGSSAQKGLSYMYSAYADEGYKLGLALRQVTQPSDLVVTIANAVGDPIAIYYSQRRGWIFPPAWPQQTWDQLPEDDTDAIQLLEKLREKRAGWIGIVDERRKEILQNYPLFVKHLERTCKLEQESPDWVIYRILTPKEIAKLPEPALGHLS